MNVLLLVFNLIPAFPLDGGRIARAVVWRFTGDRNRATKVSAYLGQGFAALLILWGLYALMANDDTTGGLWSIVLGYLLGSSARAAIAQSAFTERLKDLTVADIMDAEPVAIPADLPPRRPGRSSSCATRAGRGSPSSSPTGGTPGSPTAPRSSTPR